MKLMTFCCIVLNISFAAAETLALPQLPAPVHADTEVSTNFPFNTLRSDALEFGVSLNFMGTGSNCVQVAFGRDVDSDGDLAPEETALLLGWRSGTYFIEDSMRNVRIGEMADAVPGDARSFSIHVGLDSLFRPRSVAATNESGACFLALSDDVPDCLYGADWDLVKVTRRGVDAPGETVEVECRYRFFYISIR